MPRVQPQAELCCLNLSCFVCALERELRPERPEPGDLSKARGVLQVTFDVCSLSLGISGVQQQNPPGCVCQELGAVTGGEWENVRRANSGLRGFSIQLLLPSGTRVSDNTPAKEFPSGWHCRSPEQPLSCGISTSVEPGAGGTRRCRSSLGWGLGDPRRVTGPRLPQPGGLCLPSPEPRWPQSGFCQPSPPGLNESRSRGGSEPGDRHLQEGIVARMARGWAGDPSGNTALLFLPPAPRMGHFWCLQPRSEGTRGRGAAPLRARSPPPGPLRWPWGRPGSRSPPGARQDVPLL